MTFLCEFEVFRDEDGFTLLYRAEKQPNPHSLRPCCVLALGTHLKTEQATDQNAT